MIYGSVCSGIEAATLAWKGLGWRPAFFSEIDKAPRAVLEHHYPTIPCAGDFTKIKRGDYEAIDILVGGTPCQDSSVAGLRKGLAGDRGNLSIEFIRCAKRLRPKWICWENVPGVLSIDKGQAFGAFLGGLAECGYGFAYRVLDAQYFGIPQRRRRVFVIGYLGDWRPPAAVLFERESLYGNPVPSREARQKTSCDVRNGIASTLGAHKTGGWGVTDIDMAGAYIPEITNSLVERHDRGGGNSEGQRLIAHTLRGDGADASEDGSGRGTPLAGKSTTDPRTGSGIGLDGDPMFSLQASKQHAIAFDCKASGRNGFGESADRVPTLRAMAGKKANGGGQVAVSQASAVRRLTPRECERLMGMPDDYTLVPFGKRMMADGPRYRMIGNSMAVPVMRKIGERIAIIDKLLKE